MKRAAATAIMIIVVISMILTLYTVARAEEGNLKPVRVTGYCLRGTMANGEQTHEGAAAFRKEDIGKICRIYNDDMTLYGEFRICDTGGKRIRNGQTVDIWKPTRAECYQVTRYGFIEILEDADNDNATGNEASDGTSSDGGNGQIDACGDVQTTD